MAETTLNEGTLSLDAAGWADSIGFANGAELAIVDSMQVHTTLDRTADTTTGINYLHVRGGKPIIGPANGVLKVEFNAAYTTRPQFVWNCDGGICYLEVVALAATTIELTGSGEIRLSASGGGTWDNVAVGGRIQCFIDSTVDIVTKLTATDNAYVEIEEKAGDNIPLVEANGSARIKSDRLHVTQNIADAASIFHQNTSATTTLTITGGHYYPIGGNVPTVNHRGGVVHESAAKYSLTLGGTAYNVLSNRVRVPQSTDLVTVSNVTKDLSTGGSGAGV